MIEQAQEAYAWCVIYDDEQYTTVDERGVQNFAEVDQSHVKSLALFSLQGEAAHRVLIPTGATPIFFRRRSVELSPDGASSPRPTVHCIGWKHGDEAMYLFVFEDGSTLLSDDLQAV